MRLVDGGPNYGRVEVEVGGQWGRGMGRWVGPKDATVACRQLGFTGGVAYKPPYWPRYDQVPVFFFVSAATRF